MNLDNTAQCPQAQSCYNCQATATLDIGTYESAMGVFCLTLCENCMPWVRELRLTLPTVATLVGQHCEHLGIDLDQMAHAMQNEAESVE